MSSLASDSYEDPIPALSRSLIIKHPRAYFHPQGGYNNVRFDSIKCSEDVHVHGNHFWPDDLEQGEYACYTEGCIPYSAEESDVILAAEPIHPSIVYHGDGVTVPVLPKPAGRCLEVHESFMALVLSLCHIRYCVHSAGEQIVGIDVFPTGAAIARGVGTGLPALSTVGQELAFDGNVFVSHLDLAWAHLALDGTYVVVHLNYCDSQAHCYLSPLNFLRLFCPWYSGGPLYHGKPNPCILYDSRPVFANANYCLIDERHDVVACADQSGPLPVVVALGGRYAHALPSSKIVWVALDSFPFYIVYPANFLYSRPRPSSFSKPLPQEIVDVITQMTCGPMDDCSFALSRLAIAHSMAACGCTYYNSCRRGEELPGSLSVDIDKFYTRNMEYKENKLGRHVHMFAHPKPVTGQTREWDFKLPQMTFREWNGIRPHVSEWAGRIWWMQENLGDNHYFTPIVIEFSVHVNAPALVHGQKRWTPIEYSGNVAVAFPMQASSGNPAFDLEAMDWTDLRCTATEVLHPHVLGRIPSRPATVYINSLYLHKRLIHREEWNGEFPEDCSTPQRQEIDWDVVSQLLDEFRTFAPCNVIDMLALENWDVQKTREAIARTVAAEEAEAFSEEEDDQ